MCSGKANKLTKMKPDKQHSIVTVLSHLYIQDIFSHHLFIHWFKVHYLQISSRITRKQNKKNTHFITKVLQRNTHSLMYEDHRVGWLKLILEK